MRARLADHPIHPMLIPFPIGLFVFSLVADIVFRSGGGPVWHDMAFWTLLGGIVGALAAAAPGFIDYLSIRDTQSQRTATMHMTLNLTVVVLSVVNLLGRLRTSPDAAWPFVLSIIAVAGLCVSGWLGGTLVYREGVAMDPRIELRARRTTKDHAA